MKRILACVVLVLMAGSTFAGKGTLVRLQGWIVDSHCGAKNASEDRVQDTLECHKKGAKLVLITKDGTTYDIEDQERALEHVGQQISVFGTVRGTRMLTVGRYIGREGEKKDEDKPGLAPLGSKPKGR